MLSDDRSRPSRDRDGSDRDRRSPRRSRSRSRSPRSRSRSRSHSRSRSRSRSPRRERRKKKTGWDQGPMDPIAMAAAAQAAAMQQMGFAMDPTTQMLMQQQQAQQPQTQQPAVSGSIHPSRMTQLGNLPGAIPAATSGYNPLAHLAQPSAGGVVAPNIANMIPPHLAALMNGNIGMPGAGGANSIAPIGSTPQLNTANLPGTRQARRLYVGGIPIPISENELKVFFVEAMRSAFPDLPPGECVVSIYLNLDKKFGFVEFRTPEEATTGMGLDGIVMRGHTLRIKRPSDYNPSVHGNAPSASRIQPQVGGSSGGGGAGQISSQVPDGPNKVRQKDKTRI